MDESLELFMKMPEDLRARRTRKAIEDAFVELIEENGYAGVSVTEIARKAGVSRNTFYLHYSSKEDLTDKFVGGLFSTQFAPEIIAKMTRSGLSEDDLLGIYRDVFRTIGENVELYRLFLEDENLTGYVERLMRKIIALVLKSLPASKRTAIGVNYIVSGAYGVIKKWIIYDLGSVEEDAALLTEFTKANIRLLLPET